MRPSPRPLRVSIIVPCHIAHFPLLEFLLTAYQVQTSLPDEIVISLSEYGRVPLASLRAFRAKSWPFIVKLVGSFEKQAPGQNRNIACSGATGDLIICQDADDLPHPQRVEAIRYLFENFKIDHLIHQWVDSDGAFQPFEIEELETQCSKYQTIKSIKVPMIHNGNIAFLKEVFDRVQWEPLATIDEDRLFNEGVYALFPDHYVLSQRLIRYRGELSTFDLNGNKNQ